jgi:hypothetical protein
MTREELKRWDDLQLRFPLQLGDASTREDSWVMFQLVPCPATFARKPASEARGGVAPPPLCWNGGA